MQDRDLAESRALVVVSMVLYHGAGPWNAPVAVDDLVPGLTEYVLVRPEAVNPDGVGVQDIPALVLGLLVPGQTTGQLGRRLDALARALEFGTDPRLRERIARQLRGVLASMYDHPLLKEPGSMATMREVFTEARDADRISARNEGRDEGRLQGQARVVARLAMRRFGPETARRLSHLLAGVTDMDRLDGVAEAVVDYGRSGEFLARVEALLEADPY